MACAVCGGSRIVFSVPEEYRTHLTDDAPARTFCTTCLTLESTSVEPETEPDFADVSDAFPTQPKRAVPLALAVGLCSSLATNRAAIESLLRAVERAGVDPLLVIDRLAADPELESAIDLERRAHQLEQWLY